MIRKYPTAYVPDETAEQIAVADYLRYKHYLFIHVPNEGKRSITVARILKRMGLKPGFPDLIIFEPNGTFHALVIEMKTLKGRTSEDQEEWIRNLNAKGYYACVCKGADAAIKVIDEYLKGNAKE